MTITISLLAVGNELLDGRVTDTNSNWIGHQLRTKGLSLNKTVACTDSVSEITKSLKFLLEQSDLVLISGGLGPTTDDLTREAVAELLGVHLVQSEKCLNHVNSFFALRKRAVNPANLRQSYLPEGAHYIDNPSGSAPSFWVNFPDLRGAKLIIALPGIPQELKQIFSESVIPQVLSRFSLNKNYSEVGFRVFGIPESELGEKIESLNIPSAVMVCYRVIFPEIEVLFRGEDLAQLRRFITESKDKLGNILVLSEDPGHGLEIVIRQLLEEQGKKIAVAESCTGGMLGEILTAIAGSSAYFSGGVISYSNELKTRLLGVDPISIKEHGAVSAAVAKAMASGIRSNSGADIGISITGVAGPDGGTYQKPIGTFFVGIADSDATRAFHFLYSSNRERIRRYACFCAMDLIRRDLSALPFPVEAN